jgi:DNA-binding NarL/FixJ family response regulator
MHLKNSQGISVRVKRVLEMAGFYDKDEDESKDEDTKTLKPPPPRLPADELMERGLKVLVDVPEDAMDATKREVIREVFKAYVGGSKLPAIAEKMGISKSTVSLYL